MSVKQLKSVRTLELHKETSLKEITKKIFHALNLYILKELLVLDKIKKGNAADLDLDKLMRVLYKFNDSLNLINQTDCQELKAVLRMVCHTAGNRCLRLKLIHHYANSISIANNNKLNRYISEFGEFDKSEIALLSFAAYGNKTKVETSKILRYFKSNLESLLVGNQEEEVKHFIDILKDYKLGDVNMSILRVCCILNELRQNQEKYKSGEFSNGIAQKNDKFYIITSNNVDLNKIGSRQNTNSYTANQGNGTRIIGDLINKINDDMGYKFIELVSTYIEGTSPQYITTIQIDLAKTENQTTLKS